MNSDLFFSVCVCFLMSCLNLSCRILSTLRPLQCTAAEVSVQVWLLFTVYTVFLWVALDLHRSVASDLSRRFVQTPRAGKASALLLWLCGEHNQNSLSFHPSLGFYSLGCSWGAHPGAGLSLVSRMCVESWWNLLLFSFPGLSSPTPHSILGWSFPWPCCDCNLSLTKRYWCPICFL